ncbi:PREDICTED: deoxyuridine 5'-triphosphate nucleotidohydrolase-like [Amphimedon queenslandica]|uniref:Deoxyuridine 5'-triphosphate nucleotidohydrolase n=1 Tax=Amphimedon queenslandica TaxID=400682 RepID=A0AAN0IMB2_AMPQE|nr:PREDICTED: deoxyuridine 5'-triphosphate nucleotidohydrolase-like [Amphimedon queenslandica]|eukprot:XP_011404672.2 PREDICTED: deoxyuridine 5'-triphosphate nucleotidohydrolase-like [Amphimedon queenslandica]
MIPRIVCSRSRSLSLQFLNLHLPITTTMALVTDCVDNSATKRLKVEHSNGDSNSVEHSNGDSNSTVPLRVMKLTEYAYLPTRGSSEAAGYDLYSAYETVVPAEGKAVVKTDIAIALPPYCYGRIAPRSGLAWKHHIDIGAGVIDRDYRGNVGVIMFNLSKVDYQVHKGDRIAQLILERILIAGIEEVDNLDSTERGSGGFGSTGKN